MYVRFEYVEMNTCFVLRLGEYLKTERKARNMIEFYMFFLIFEWKEKRLSSKNGHF